MFGLIIFVHESGHFLLAKINKIRVDEFSIGMGPRLISFVKGETRYSLKLLPIGGSCMMGEDDVDDVGEGSFNSKSVWARISVVVAGAIFNFIFALLLSMIVVGHYGYDKPIVGEIVADSPAEKAGLQVGDKIVKMNNKKINIWREVLYYNSFHPGETVEMIYERNGARKEVTIIPRLNDNGEYKMGIGPFEEYSKHYTKANLFTAAQYGVYEVKFWICTTVESLKMLVTGVVGADQLSGPVGIVKIADEAFDSGSEVSMLDGILQIVSLGIIISANLGVMNLLPLPALDGGRLVFMFIEAIRGKRVSPEKEGWVHGIGMILLLALMAFVLFNDVKRLF